MDLAWVEIKGPRSGLRVCVFIEREADRTGLEECERVNHALSARLDAEDPIPGPYTLEVSTPGIFRPLRSLDDCRRFVGRRVRVRYRDEDHRCEVRSVLERVEDQTLITEAGPVEWAEVETARLDPDVDALLRRGRG